MRLNPQLQEESPALELIGDKFLINITLPEYSSPGIVNLIRDPRKLDMKPDAYTGVVEEVSEQCKLVKVGDRVVIERWEYSQWNYDDERIVAREVDLLILPNDVAAPGVTVLQTLDLTKKSNILVPDTLRLPDSKFYFGKVLSTDFKFIEVDGVPSVKVGDFIYLMKTDRQQYYSVGQHTLVFKVYQDAANPLYATIPLVIRKEDIYE